MTIDIDKDYNLFVGLRIREIRESLHLSVKNSVRSVISRPVFSQMLKGEKSLTSKTIYKICTACNISADYIVLGHKEGFDKDVGIELLNSFNDEEMEHIINILYEIRKPHNKTQKNTQRQSLAIASVP